MSSIYRIRPVNDYTIDELNNHYLWFSRRSGFNEHNDANVGTFLNKNKVLANTFKRLFNSEGIKVFRNNY